MSESDVEKLKKKLDASIDALNDLRLRWLLGRAENLVKNNKVDAERMMSLLDEVVEKEIERHMILREIEKNPLTIGELAEVTKLDPKRILFHIIALRWAGLVTEVGEKKGGYVYSKP